MINRLKEFFTRESAKNGPSKHSPDELHIAAAGLMIEAASMDGHIDESEREQIADLVGRHFNVGPDEVAEIIAAGEKKAQDAVDIYGFLRLINTHFDEAERVLLVEMLWEVAYADGVLHDHEAALVRRVTGLLGVTDRDAGSARKRAMTRLGVD